MVAISASLRTLIIWILVNVSEPADKTVVRGVRPASRVLTDSDPGFRSYNKPQQPVRHLMNGRLIADLRLATRHLLRSPGYLVAALITFALAIGANSAIFSAV